MSASALPGLNLPPKPAPVPAGKAAAAVGKAVTAAAAAPTVVKLQTTSAPASGSAAAAFGGNSVAAALTQAQSLVKAQGGAGAADLQAMLSAALATLQAQGMVGAGKPVSGTTTASTAAAAAAAAVSAKATSSAAGGGKIPPVHAVEDTLASASASAAAAGATAATTAAASGIATPAKLAHQRLGSAELDAVAITVKLPWQVVPPSDLPLAGTTSGTAAAGAGTGTATMSMLAPSNGASASSSRRPYRPSIAANEERDYDFAVVVRADRIRERKHATAALPSLATASAASGAAAAAAAAMPADGRAPIAPRSDAATGTRSSSRARGHGPASGAGNPLSESDSASESDSDAPSDSSDDGTGTGTRSGARGARGRSRSRSRSGSRTTRTPRLRRVGRTHVDRHGNVIDDYDMDDDEDDDDDDDDDASSDDEDDSESDASGSASASETSEARRKRKGKGSKRGGRRHDSGSGSSAGRMSVGARVFSGIAAAAGRGYALAKRRLSVMAGAGVPTTAAAGSAAGASGTPADAVAVAIGTAGSSATAKPASAKGKHNRRRKDAESSSGSGSDGDESSSDAEAVVRLSGITAPSVGGSSSAAATAAKRRVTWSGVRAAGDDNDDDDEESSSGSEDGSDSSRRRDKKRSHKKEKEKGRKAQGRKHRGNDEEHGRAGAGVGAASAERKGASSAAATAGASSLPVLQVQLPVPLSAQAGAKHKCSEILAALRDAGLYAKRVRSLSRRTWLLKIGAPQWRLEMEAERLRLRMRRRDGGWSRFKRSLRHAFMPSIPEDDEADAATNDGEAAPVAGSVGASASGAAGVSGGATIAAAGLLRSTSHNSTHSHSHHHDDDELADPHGLDGPSPLPGAAGGAGGFPGSRAAGSGAGGGSRTGGSGSGSGSGRGSAALGQLFHSSDRQTLIDHILRSSEREGGAGLGEGSELGAYVTHMFPLHMVARLEELRSDWLAIWRPLRSHGERDRIGGINPAWYAPSRLIDLKTLQTTTATATASGVVGAAACGVSPLASSAEPSPSGATAPKLAQLASTAAASSGKGVTLVGAATGGAALTVSSGRRGGGGSGSGSGSDDLCFPGCCPSGCCTNRCCGRCLSVLPRCLSLPIVCFMAALFWAGVCACKTGRSLGRCCSRPLWQPLDRIAAYFGETVAFYFAWLQFYTIWLVPPAAAGVLVFLAQMFSGSLEVAWVPLYSLGLALWSILMLHLWKRRNAELAQRWGVLAYEDEEVVRPAFVGLWKQDAATGTIVRVYPLWRRVLKYCVTVPIILAFVAASVLLMVFVFSTRDQLLGQLNTYETAVAERSAVLAALASPNVTAAERANVTAALGPPPVLHWDVRESIVAAWEGGVAGFLAGVQTVDLSPSELSSSAAAAAVAAAAADAGAGGGASSTGTGTGIDFSSLSWSAVSAKLLAWEAVLTSQHDWRWWVAMTLPPVIYGLLMPLIDGVFGRVALAFNDWENHATESSYRNHRIAKVFFYRFSSSFVSLFYYSFSPRSSSVATLFVQLATFLLLGQLLKRNVVSLAFARARKAWVECRAARRVRQAEDSGLTEGRRGRRLLRHATSAAWVEARLPVYDTFNDYAELLIQFGYVTFFSWAFPLGPAIALLNNVIEMRAGAYRLCYLTQRPVAHKAGGIGVWYRVLQAMALLAILTNTAHLALSSRQVKAFFPSLTDAQRLLLVFLFEHCVLGARLLLGFVVPTEPAGVRRRAARDAWNLAKLQGRRSMGDVAAAGGFALGGDAALAPAVPLALAAAAAVAEAEAAAAAKAAKSGGHGVTAAVVAGITSPGDKGSGGGAGGGVPPSAPGSSSSSSIAAKLRTLSPRRGMGMGMGMGTPAAGGASSGVSASTPSAGLHSRGASHMTADSCTDSTTSVAAAAGSVDGTAAAGGSAANGNGSFLASPGSSLRSISRTIAGSARKLLTPKKA